MSNSNTAKTCDHQRMNDEEAAMMIVGLRNKIHIQLEGVDIVRGYSTSGRYVTIVSPAAGDRILLNPFD